MRKSLFLVISLSILVNGIYAGGSSKDTYIPDTDSIISKNNEPEKEKDYVNLLLFKVNKGKGYKKQPFEMEDSYALLQKRVTFFSFNVGFVSNDINNYWLEPLAIVDNVYNRNFSTHISAGHFIGNNLALGIKFGYKYSDMRMRVNADILDLVIGAKSYETNNLSKSYSGAFALKNYIPLDASQRLFLVSETNLTYSNTHGLSRNIYDNGVKIHKVLRESNTIGLGISPGFMYFMSRGFAFEFALNPVLVYWEKSTYVNNEVEKGSATNYGLSFKFMPFNIQFGFAYYFGLDYVKHGEWISRKNR